MSHHWDDPFPEPGDKVRARRRVFEWLAANDWPESMAVSPELLETIAVVYFESLASEDDEMDLSDMDYGDYGRRAMRWLVHHGHTTLPRTDSGVRLVVQAARSSVPSDFDADQQGTYRPELSVTQPPDDAPAWRRLNSVLDLMGDPSVKPRVLLEMIRDVQETDSCVEFDQIARVHELRARVLRRMGRNDSARRSMAAALRGEVESGLPSAWFATTLADWELEDGRVDEALGTLRHALRSTEYVLSHPRVPDGFALVGGLTVHFDGIILDLENVIDVLKRCPEGAGRSALQRSIHDLRAANGLFGEMLPEAPADGDV